MAYILLPSAAFKKKQKNPSKATVYHLGLFGNVETFCVQTPDSHACVKQDYIDTQMLLSSENVNQEALLCYAREAADFGTNYQLPTLDFAMNHCGQPDVAMFDFTNMYASDNAALVRERFGHQLLVALVGDSLLEVRMGK